MLLRRHQDHSDRCSLLRYCYRDRAREREFKPKGNNAMDGGGREKRERGMVENGFGGQIRDMGCLCLFVVSCTHERKYIPLCSGVRWNNVSISGIKVELELG